MGLAGKLTDLSLAELLQVIALSRKNGALEICSESGVAWLGVYDGGVVRVALDDGSLDRTEVLRQAGLENCPDTNRVEATVSSAAIHGIIQLFGWKEGDFTFETLDDPTGSWRGPEGIILSPGLSPEFLALEGARLEDEHENLPRPAGETPIGDEMPAESADVLPEESVAEAEPAGPDPAAERGPQVVICVDENLELLEGMKESLQPSGARVHIFQSPEDALGRLKHYLVRGEQPGFVVGAGVRDPLDARSNADWSRFVSRVRGLAPRIPLVVFGTKELRTDQDVTLLVAPHPAAKPDETRAFLRELAGALGLGS